MTTHQLKIEGMTCGHCVRAVEDALREVPGVRTVQVEIGRATVEADDTVELQSLLSAVEEEEFQAEAG